MTQPTDTLTTEAMILLGHGYELAIAPEAEQRRDKLMQLAGMIAAVTTNDQSAAASYVLRQLADMRLAVEKCRKEVKEPVNRIAKLIDTTARNFLDPISDEECRIKQLVSEHATRMAAARATKEQAEREAFDKAREAREAAESGKLSAVIASKQALAERLQASNEVHATKTPDGVRFAWDFDVVDVDALYREAPNLVTIEPKRAEILKRVREIAASLKDEAMIGEFFECYGIRVFQKPVVSTR